MMLSKLSTCTDICAAVAQYWRGLQAITHFTHLKIKRYIENSGLVCIYITQLVQQPPLLSLCDLSELCEQHPSTPYRLWPAAAQLPVCTAELSVHI